MRSQGTSCYSQSQTFHVKMNPLQAMPKETDNSRYSIRQGLIQMSTIYLASPLGFSPENGHYLEKIKARLTSQGLAVFDPWEQTQSAPDIAQAFTIERYPERVSAFRRISSEIGKRNEDGIRNADMLFAVLDGTEIDSGTASEVGFASALGKRCYGLRTDMRDSGDFLGVPVNLQVLHFIERTGGKLFRCIDDVNLGVFA